MDTRLTQHYFGQQARMQTSPANTTSSNNHFTNSLAVNMEPALQPSYRIFSWIIQSPTAFLAARNSPSMNPSKTARPEPKHLSSIGSLPSRHRLGACAWMKRQPKHRHLSRVHKVCSDKGTSTLPVLHSKVRLERKE
ncbi:hypothetical protein B0T21DRAFT_360631 [Apiosordaria backusii]|uniref:Uncharacterized protein n=1 Tax=Apiosordaria backusii TaxID=314023 RepID=A0AA40EMK1_9PEZI|nr:hypothetical protein B0T21DRAFT_360631 [Apiosordaria backusii]